MSAEAATPSGYVALGRASWARAAGYHLAVPAPVGTRVRVCGPGGCVERESTVVGGPVVELSRADFRTVSGRESVSDGDSCLATVEYLDHPDVR